MKYQSLSKMHSCGHISIICNTFKTQIHQNVCLIAYLSVMLPCRSMKSIWDLLMIFKFESYSGILECHTYILLQRSAPHCHKGRNETFCVNTHISNSANTNTQKYNTYAQFCISWIPNVVEKNFQQAGYRDHTQLSNLPMVKKKI